MSSWKPPTNPTHICTPSRQEQLRPPRHLSSSVTSVSVEGCGGGIKAVGLFISIAVKSADRTPAVLFIMPITSWAINTETYNNIIYDGVHINIDLCAVTAADLPSAWIRGRVAPADGLIENQSVQANRRSASHQRTEETSPKLQNKGSTGVNKSQISQIKQTNKQTPVLPESGCDRSSTESATLMRADVLICSKQPTLIKVQSERLTVGVFHLRTVARFSDGISRQRIIRLQDKDTLVKCGVLRKVQFWKIFGTSCWKPVQVECHQWTKEPLFFFNLWISF